MKKLRWQLLIIFLTGLVVSILLLIEQPETLPPVGNTPEPVRGGVYTEALVGSLQRINPFLAGNNAVDRDLSRLIFSGLVRFDARGVPQPDLAAEWGISEDGTLYNVTLREGLTWHDGKPITAEDVVFTIDLIRTGGSLVPADLQAFWKEVESVALSDTVIQFRLPEAFAPFLDYLNIGLLPKHLLDGKTIESMVNEPFNLEPIGSGPYRFSRILAENDQIVGVALAAFDGYYGTKPFIEDLVFRFYPDAQAALQAYRNGEVQGIGQIPRELLPEALSEPDLSIYTARMPRTSMVLFNLNNAEVGFLQDKTIRKALLLGLNRQGMVDRILNGQGILAEGPILPGTWAYYDGLEAFAYDPEEARQLLRKAGYSLASEEDTILSKEGKFLQLTLLYPDTDTHRQMAEAIQANWRELGVQVDLEAQPYDELVTERLVDRTYQAALVELNLARSPDPDPYPFWDQAQAAGGQNYAQWNNRMASEYLEQARITTDLSRRAKLYRSFQVVFHDELPALPLFYPVYSYGVDNEIQGVTIGPLFDTSDRFANVVEWYLPGLQNNPAPQVPEMTPTQP
jgi:peptide/nickel transport system substrate-binding protein